MQVLHKRALALRLSTLECSRRNERLCCLQALYSLHAARLRILDSGQGDVACAAAHPFLTETADELQGVDDGHSSLGTSTGLKTFEVLSRRLRVVT